jgi:hypothetical protein
MATEQLLGLAGLAFFGAMLVVSLYFWSKRDDK